MEQPKPKTVHRRVQFLSAKHGSNPSGKSIDIEPEQWIEQITRLGFGDGEEGESRYLPQNDDEVLWVRPIDGTKHPSIQFCLSRRSALPQKEREGDILDLGMQADEGLVEAIHIVFFEKNVVGCEYNHYGPRISRLPAYLGKKVGNLDQLQLNPLLKGNPQEAAERLLDLRELELDITPAFVDAIPGEASIFRNALNGQLRLVDGSERVSLVLKFDRNSRYAALLNVWDQMKQVIRWPGYREQADRFKARGLLKDINRVRTLDFLSDALIGEADFECVDARSRAIDPVKAVETIDAVHSELGDELNAVSSVEGR